jgi:RNA polymerase sigma factor (TIGR02999 family)
METTPSSAFATLFASARQGDEGAIGRLYQILHRELRQLARSRLRAHSPITMLDTTALVNESYLRLAGTAHMTPADRNHFLAYSAHVMRSVIVDFVRRKQAQRRGGGQCLVTLDTSVEAVPDDSCADLVRIGEAMEELAAVDARAARVVEMRYFAGMNDADIARVLEVTERTVQRDWAKAKLLLQAALA